MVHGRLEALFHPQAHHALGRLHAQGRVVRDLTGDLHGLLHQVVVGYDAVHEAEFERLLGIEHIAEERDFRGLGPAEQAGEIPAAAGFREHAALREDGAHLRVLAGNADIAAEGHIHAVAGCGAVEGADHWLVHAVDDDGRAVVEVEQLVASAAGGAGAVGGLFLEVETGAEAAPGAGHDNGANLARDVGLHKHAGQFAKHGTANRVHALGAVEGDGENALIEIDEQLGRGGFKGHGSLQEWDAVRVYESLVPGASSLVAL